MPCAFSGGINLWRKPVRLKKNPKVSSHVTVYLATVWDLCCRRTVVHLERHVQRMRESRGTNPLLRGEQTVSRKRNAFAQDRGVKIVVVHPKVSLRTLWCHFPPKFIFISVNNPAMSTFYRHHLSENSMPTNNETGRKGHY